MPPADRPNPGRATSGPGPTDSDRDDPRRPIARRVGEPLALAFAITLIAVAWSSPLVLSPGSQSLLPTAHASELFAADQGASISGAGRNAAAILAGDFGRLIEQRICHPTPMAAALSEHMIELGVLGVPGYAISRNPVLAYNLACLLMLVIAGTGAFVLLRYWSVTSGTAAVIALAFAFHPYRLDDLAHPYGVATHWLPWILYAFERLIDSGRLRFAVALAITATLQGLTGGYLLLASTWVLGSFGAVRLWQRRAEVDARRGGWLAAAIAVTVLGVGPVITTYGVVWETWSFDAASHFVLIPWRWLLPGGATSLGMLLLILAALGVAASRRATPNPVAGLLVGTVGCLLIAAGFGDPQDPADLVGLYPWLAAKFSLLGVVRVPAVVRNGAVVGLVLLAGFGLDGLLARVGERRRSAVTAIVGLVLMAEIFVPAIAKRSYGIDQTVALHRAAPPRGHVAAHAALHAAGFDGPVVDLPFKFGAFGLQRLSRQMVVAGFHNQPTPACYGSRFPPTFQAVGRMVDRVAAGEGITELAASGFRNLVRAEADGATDPIAAALRARPDVSLVHAADGFSAYRIDAPRETHSDTARLSPDTDLEPVRGTSHWILRLANAAEVPWVLPPPIEPVVGRLRWRSRESPGDWEAFRLLLPLALAAGAVDSIRIELGEPPAGCDCDPELEFPELGWHFEGPQRDRS